jgi:hypothetical protein
MWYVNKKDISEKRDLYVVFVITAVITIAAKKEDVSF